MSRWEDLKRRAAQLAAEQALRQGWQALATAARGLASSALDDAEAELARRQQAPDARAARLEELLAARDQREARAREELARLKERGDGSGG